jgi:glycosyltransferase involved in cell wall biosynthesis
MTPADGRAGPKISAVLCTHNRADRLRDALQSLRRQTLPPDAFEIIVVDNRSTDSTPALVRDLQSSAPNLRYVREEELGLNPARNRGWQSATAPYVAYLDDDAVAAPEWLEALVAAFETVRPTPAAVGGRIDPIWESPRPPWLSDSLLDMYSVCDYSPTGTFLKDVLHQRNLVGANIAFSRSALERVGGFTRGLDRIGTNLLSGGELLVQLQLEDLGLPIYYEPRAAVGHLVPAARVSKHWLRSRCYWGGISDALIVFFRAKPTTLRSAKLCLYALRTCTISPLVLIDWVMGADNPESLKRSVHAWTRIGFLRGALRTLGTGSAR